MKKKRKMKQSTSNKIGYGWQNNSKGETLMVREFLHNTQRKMELINCIRRQEARRNEIIRKEAFSRFLRVVQYVKDCYGEETARRFGMCL